MNKTVQQRAAVIAECRTAVTVYFELVRTRRLQTQYYNKRIVSSLSTIERTYSGIFSPSPFPFLSPFSLPFPSFFSSFSSLSLEVGP